LNIVSPLATRKSPDNFGTGIAIADVAGSTAKDLIVGAPTTGRVFVFPGPVNASNYLTLSSDIGRKVAAGLVNGDAFNDLLATTASAAKVYNGLVTSGESPSFLLQPARRLDTGWATTEPDNSDVDNDSLADVLIGAPNAASGSTCGGVVYLYLSSLGLPLSTRLTISTPVPDPQGVVFGWAATFAPGTRLFFVTDHGLKLGTTTAGQVYVFKVN